MDVEEEKRQKKTIIFNLFKIFHMENQFKTPFLCFVNP